MRIEDNHLHVLVRLEPDAVNGWSAEGVVRRWLAAYPPKSADGQAIEVTQAWINDLAGDERLPEPGHRVFHPLTGCSSLSAVERLQSTRLRTVGTCPEKGMRPS